MADYLTVPILFSAYLHEFQNRVLEVQYRRYIHLSQTEPHRHWACPFEVDTDSWNPESECPYVAGHCPYRKQPCVFCGISISISTS